VHDVSHSVMNKLRAEAAREEGNDLLTLTSPVLQAGGEALAFDPDSDRDWTSSQDNIIDTLQRPNTISVGASEQRLVDAEAIGVLKAAVDASMSVRARNSFEKMLCHQMAAAHHFAMRWLEKAAVPGMPPAEVVRLGNGASRLMDTFQSGML